MLQDEFKRVLRPYRRSAAGAVAAFGSSIRLSSWLAVPDVQTEPVIFLDFSLLRAIENKLSQTAARVKSIEFNRQCLLATHSLRTFHSKTTTRDVPVVFLSFSSALNEERSYKRPTLVWRDLDTYLSDQLIRASGWEPDLGPNRVRAVTWEQQYKRVNQFFLFDDFSPLINKVLFHCFSTLIDKAAEYWTQIVEARETFKSFSIGTKLRQRIKTGLKFKPFHTPVRIVPRSIHPIESAI